MATTKTPDKKSTKKAAGSAESAQVPAESLAAETLVSFLHQALVRLSEAARITDIVRETGEDSISAGVARQALEHHPGRFVSVDRRWDLSVRYLDKQQPVSRTLEEIVYLYGRPMPLTEVVLELSTIYGRVPEHFEVVAPRMLRGDRFFATSDGLHFGLRSWLLDTGANLYQSVSDEDVLFYNYLDAATVAAFEKAAGQVDWENDPTSAIPAIVAYAKGAPIDNRLIQYAAWKSLRESFDGIALYNALYAETDRLTALSDHRWLGSDGIEKVREVWRSQADQVADLAAEEPVAESPSEVEIRPLEINAGDLQDIVRFFEGREDVVTAATLLTEVLEARPSNPSFVSDADTLTDFLKARPDQFVGVGTQRFRTAGTLPPYIGQVPESLNFPTLPRFETPDGEILDQLLVDAAFEEGLAEEILDPVAQDVNDKESPQKTLWPEGVTANSPWLRLVLKEHHKEIGTFPLAQVPPGFFPAEPNIVELTLRDASGNRYPIYVDYDVQLIYGLFDLYDGLAAQSGAVFHVEKTEKPDEYKFVYNNETDSAVFVNPNRLDELAGFRTEVESGPVSTYEIIRRILDHYRKGSSFLTLLTEVNLVRRTPRRLVASILSSYTAFHQRANKWTFDPKKEAEGFDKRKTGYIVKK